MLALVRFSVEADSEVAVRELVEPLVGLVEAEVFGAPEVPCEAGEEGVEADWAEVLEFLLEPELG